MSWNRRCSRGGVAGCEPWKLVAALLLGLALLAMAAADAMGASVGFVLQDFKAAATTNRTVFITPQYLEDPGVVSSMDRLRFSSGNGTFWVSNMYAGTYQLEIAAPPSSTRWTFWVDSTNAVQWAGSNIVRYPQNSPSLFYTRSQVDGLLGAGAGGHFAQAGTNLVGTTNGTTVTLDLPFRPMPASLEGGMATNIVWPAVTGDYLTASTNGLVVSMAVTGLQPTNDNLTAWSAIAPTEKMAAGTFFFYQSQTNFQWRMKVDGSGEGYGEWIYDWDVNSWITSPDDGVTASTFLKAGTNTISNAGSRVNGVGMTNGVLTATGTGLTNIPQAGVFGLVSALTWLTNNAGGSAPAGTLTNNYTGDVTFQSNLTVGGTFTAATQEVGTIYLTNPIAPNAVSATAGSAGQVLSCVDANTMRWSNAPSGTYLAAGTNITIITNGTLFTINSSATAGGGGDIYAASNNIFTASNRFTGGFTVANGTTNVLGTNSMFAAVPANKYLKAGPDGLVIGTDAVTGEATNVVWPAVSGSYLTATTNGYVVTLAGAGVQPTNANLTSWASFTPTGYTNGLATTAYAQLQADPRQWGSANLTNWSAYSTTAYTNGLAHTTYVTTATNGSYASAQAYANGLAGNYQPTNQNLTAWSGYTTSGYTNGLAPTTYVASATNNSFTSAKAYADGLAGNYQPANVNLTAWSAYTTTAYTNGLAHTTYVNSYVTAATNSNYASAQAYANGLAGNYQPTNANLTLWSSYNPSTYTNGLGAGGGGGDVYQASNNIFTASNRFTGELVIANGKTNVIGTNTIFATASAGQYLKADTDGRIIGASVTGGDSVWPAVSGEYLTAATNGSVVTISATGVQPTNANLTSWAGVTPVVYSNAVVAVSQPASANLTSWAGVTPVAYSNGVVAVSQPISANLTSWSSQDPTTYSAASATNLENAHFPIPTNTPTARARLVATSTSSSQWINGYMTNQAATTPDFTMPYGEFTTNAAFTFPAPTGVSTKEYQTTVIMVTNSTAAAVAITAPANVHVQGTPYVTNVTVFTFFNCAGRWTNLIAYPLW